MNGLRWVRDNCLLCRFVVFVTFFEGSGSIADDYTWIEREIDAGGVGIDCYEESLVAENEMTILAFIPCLPANISRNSKQYR